MISLNVSATIASVRSSDLCPSATSPTSPNPSTAKPCSTPSPVPCVTSRTTRCSARVSLSMNPWPPRCTATPRPPSRTSWFMAIASPPVPSFATAVSSLTSSTSTHPLPPAPTTPKRSSSVPILSPPQAPPRSNPPTPTSRRRCTATFGRRRNTSTGCTTTSWLSSPSWPRMPPSTSTSTGTSVTMSRSCWTKSSARTTSSMMSFGTTDVGISRASNLRAITTSYWSMRRIFRITPITNCIFPNPRSQVLKDVLGRV